MKIDHVLVVGLALILFGFGLMLFAGLLDRIKKQSADEFPGCKNITEIERIRKEIPCIFSDGISETEFSQLAFKSKSQIKRIKDIEVDDALIECIVESQTGNTEWKFCVDFNDWGHLTGKNWVTSENTESNIPQRFSDMLKEYIRELYEDRGVLLESFSELICNNMLDRKAGSLNPIWLWIGNLFDSKIVQTKYSSMWFAGEHLFLVASILHDVGFKDIKAIPVRDIDKRNEFYMYEVDRITIGGCDVFGKEDWFRRNSEVVIFYHLKKEIEIPYNERYFKRRNYNDVVAELSILGFANITERPVRDLMTGWIAKQGSVDRVQVIDSKEKPISKGDIYEYDVEIVVCYHTF